MALLGILPKNKKHKLIAVFDVGNALISGALIEVTGAGHPIVHYTTEHVLRVNAIKPSTKRLLLAVEEALRTVSQDLSRVGLSVIHKKRNDLRAPSKAYVILSAPWYASLVKNITVNHTKPFTVSHELLHEIAEKEISAFTQGDGVSILGNGKNKIIENKISHIEINGYEVNNPYGKTAHVLSSSLLISVAPQLIIDLVRGIIGRAFHVEEIVFHSFLFSLFDTIRDLWQNEKNYLLIDVSGEMTEVSYVKEGILIESATFPIGSTTLIRKFGSVTGNSFGESASLIELYNDDKVSLPVRSKVEQNIENAFVDWVSFLSNTCDELTGGFSIPGTIFITVDSPLRNWFKKVLENKSFQLLTSGQSTVSVHVISGESLAQNVEHGTAVKKNVFIDIDSIFSGKLEQFS